MTHVQQVSCDSFQSCNDITIRGSNYISITWGQSMNNGTIVSELTGHNSNILNIVISNLTSTTPMDIEIFCNETDTCRIDCQGENSCANVKMYCFGTCRAYCDLTGGLSQSICPTMIIGNLTQTYTNYPTQMPTNPSPNPTFMPISPTFIPTANPTNDFIGMD